MARLINASDIRVGDELIVADYRGRAAAVDVVVNITSNNADSIDVWGYALTMLDGALQWTKYSMKFEHDVKVLLKKRGA